MARSLSNQDISWFLDLADKGQLNLDPPYQRRSVWSPRDKRFFIDTILNGYPAPPVFLHKTLDDSGRATYHVVDGKQRIQTILAFRDNKITIPEDFANVHLQKKRWKDLGRDTKEDFWNYILIVEMLPEVTDAFVKNIFERINRNSRKLMPQELRHAKFDGWFVTTAESEAEKPIWKTFGISTTARAKRMANVQFVSELMAIQLLSSISGFDQDSLDNIYADYDDLIDQPDFDVDEFIEKFESVKVRLEELTRIEPRLAQYLKVQSQFYSIWGMLVLEAPDIADAVLAKRYFEFLEEVARSPDHTDGLEESYAESVRTYAQNVKGASTEFPQRSERHKMLKRVLLAS